MDFKLQLVVVPVSDMDRAKDFYMQQAGFGLHVDTSPGEQFRVIHLTPRGSDCDIALMQNKPAAGSLHGLHLVVSDIEAAHAELAGRGLGASEPFHFADGLQQPGPDPERRSYNSFFTFSDPDGNSWMVQEVRPPEAAA